MRQGGSTAGANPWRWLIGRGMPPPTVPLRGGRLGADLQDLDLVDIRFGDIRILQRLAIRVRDTAWGTVPHIDQKTTILATDNGFEITVGANNRGRGIDFTWQATIRAHGDGSLDFDFAGEALSDCTYNRIGIIALFPLSIAGRAFRARQGDASWGGELPVLVAPQTVRDGLELPLFPAFNHVDISLGEENSLALELEGDLFEMEDHRNWADGSFKLYSTPLAAPVPMILKKGEPLRQRLRFAFTGNPLPIGTQRPDGDSVILTCGGPLERELPPIGVSLDTDEHVLDAAESSLLRELRLAHVRVEVGGEALDPTTLLRAGDTAAALGASLELVLRFPPERGNIGPALAALAPRLAELPIARLMLLPTDATVTPPEWIGQARSATAGRYPLAIGTNSNFVELNRSRPSGISYAGLAYGINPQVHDDDELALVSSLEGQTDTIRTVRSFAPGMPVHVGPITLKPRPSGRPDAPSARSLPADVDARQATCFGAAWLAGSAKHLAEAGASTLTYFEATGWRGLVERTTGSPAPDLFPSEPGAPFPMFYVLAMLAPLRGTKLNACTSSAHNLAEAIILDDPAGLRALIWSFAQKSLPVRLRNLPSGQYRLQHLVPDGRAQSKFVSLIDGELKLVMSPYGVSFLAKI